MDYFGARYYASTQGRFTSSDEPFADQHRSNPQSWNLYSYVRNNPLGLVDPTGNAAESPCDKICQDSKKRAEEERKKAEEEGIDVEVIDMEPPAAVEVILASAPPPTPWEKGRTWEVEFDIPAGGGLRFAQKLGVSRFTSFFRKLFGGQRAVTAKRTVREIAEELGYSPSNAVKKSLKGGVSRESIPATEREIAAKFYERVANEVVSGPKEEAAKALNLARAKFLR